MPEWNIFTDIVVPIITTFLGAFLGGATGATICLRIQKKRIDQSQKAKDGAVQNQIGIKNGN